MTDKAAEVAAIGGSRPAATGPGATGGGPTEGGLAVPNDEVLMGGGGSLGDTAGMDDGGLNSGDTLEESAGAAASPQAAMPNTENASPAPGAPASGDAPTGGLSGTPVPSSGTVGGSPTGTAASGMGDKGG
jgi:hypothetical protein